MDAGGLGWKSPSPLLETRPYTVDSEPHMAASSLQSRKHLSLRYKEPPMSQRRLLWLTLVVLLALGPSLAGRAAPASAAPAGQGSSTADLHVESVVGGLATIWAIDFAPDGRIFLSERGGRIRTITNGALDPEP